VISPKSYSLALSFLIFSCLTSRSSAFANEKVFDGWRLSQRCTYQGDVQIAICPYAVKVFVPKNGLTILYISPFKEVIYFDKNTGMTCTVPAAKDANPFQKTVALLDGVILVDVPFQKPSPSDVCGLPGLIYKTSPQFAEKQLALFKSRSIKGNEAKSAAYEVITSVHGAPLELKFVSRFFGIPNLGAMSATFKYTNLAGEIKRHLETVSCTKSKISESEFVVPPHLKMADSVQAVLAGSQADMLMP
jgi:hypothetical protein